MKTGEILRVTLEPRTVPTFMSYLTSPADAVASILDGVSVGNSVLETIIGPGPCLLAGLDTSAASTESWTAQAISEIAAMHAFELEGTLVEGLSTEDKLAIRLHCIDPPDIHMVLNSAFRVPNLTREAVRNQAPFARRLIEAYRKLAVVPGMLYEGRAFLGKMINGTMPDQLEWQRKCADPEAGFPVGSTITFSSFTSAVCTNFRIAEMFGDSLFFVFTRVRGVRIHMLSPFPEECEICLEPPSMFRIVSWGQFCGVTQVHLEHIESPLRYLTA